MGSGVKKVRKAGLGLSARVTPGDPLNKAIGKFQHRLDEKLESKGAFAESTAVKKSEKKKETEREQKNIIGRQKQRETLRLAEAESDVGRAKLLRKTGGRRSLIASR